MDTSVGQLVPKIKGILSRDCANLEGQYVPMDEADCDKEWRDKFRQRLREVRGERTREDMADLLGVSPSAYAKWEDRGSECPIRLLPKIWKIGQVSPEWLLEGREPQQKAVKKQEVGKKAAS